jgi:multidrug efflux system membrane fusion protein
VATDQGLESLTRKGMLDLIDNQVDPTTGTIQLRATFGNADNALWPGTFENVDLTVYTEPGVLVVPSQAVQTGQAGTFVFVVDKDSIAHQCPVTVERSERNSTILTSAGLAPGTEVVVDGQSQVNDKSSVEVHTPAAVETSGVAPDAPATTVAR